MIETEDKTLSELIVTEAVEKAMDTPLRESILDGIDAAGERQQTGRRLPLAGILFGLGAAIGFLAGREAGEIDQTSLEDIQEPEIIEDVMGTETGESTDTETETDTDTLEADDDSETESPSSRLPKLLLVVGAIAGAVFLRRRLGESNGEEWEPIEEFEPATPTESDEETDRTGMDEEGEPDERPSQQGTDDSSDDSASV